MKKNLLAAIFILGLTSNSGIYDFSITRIEGGTVSLSSFAGKKLLVITLPIEQSATADSLLHSLDTLAAAHSADLAVVAVPTVEDGYSPSAKSELQNWYRSKLGNYVTVTDGMYSRKTSGVQQHPLFQWLTNSSGNGTFDIDCEGSGTKFFADEQGKLYSVLRPITRISGKSVQKVLQQ